MRFKILKFLSKTFTTEKVRQTLDFFSYYFGGIFRKIEDDHIFLAAAGIAFSLILSFIPFILVLFAILGNIISPDALLKQISELIDTTIPYPEHAEFVKEFFRKRLPSVFSYKDTAAYIGVFGLMFTSTWLFSSLRSILNHIFEVDKKKSAWYGLIKDFGMILLVMLIITLSTVIFPVMRIMIDYALESPLFQELHLNTLISYLLSFSSFFILFGLFYLFYFAIPYERIGHKVILISSLTTTILWASAKYVFGYYVNYFLKAENLYGAFLLFIVILFWIFYSSILFLIGAEVGMLYKKRKLEKGKEKNGS
jgi:membrane protein